MIQIRFQNTGKICSWYPESWTLESEIQLKESGIPLTIGIRNESGIQYVKSLGLPYVERNRAQVVWKQADVGTI